MDNMACAWNLPEEDELAMLLLTLQSPYLSVAFPDNRGKGARFNDLRSGLTDREMRVWQDSFLRFLRKVTWSCGGKRLVLKSPPHTARIPILHRLFPRALYIYLVRDPCEVFASTVRLRQVMAKLSGLSQVPPSNLDEEVLETYMKMYHAYHLHRALVDDARRCELRYEDLVADPESSLARIYEKFELPGWPAVQSRLRVQLESHRQYQPARASLSQAERERVWAHWSPAFRRYGYAGPGASMPGPLRDGDSPAESLEARRKERR
jgi:hypothetical protein